MADIKMILNADRERLVFARTAAAYLNAHPEARSYSDHGDPKPGELFALRWASPKDKPVVSLLVFALPYDALIVGDLDDGMTPAYMAPEQPKASQIGANVPPLCECIEEYSPLTWDGRCPNCMGLRVQEKG